MSPLRRIKSLITGLEIPQEFICVSSDILNSALRIYLESQDGSESYDVTDSHVFLGYKPVIISISADKDSVKQLIGRKGAFILKFVDPLSESKNNEVAQLTVSKLEEYFEINGCIVYLLEGVQGSHELIPPHYRSINALRHRRKGGGNVNLDGNLQDQVRIAYSYPRQISLITWSEGHRMNMFPTDLHGPLSSDHYVGSLRVGGKATTQIERIQRIVLSNISVTAFEKAYHLGKNHMQEPRPFEAFEISTNRSLVNGMVLPTDVISYYELELERTINIGIHNIHLYKIQHFESQQNEPRLYHIHQYYAQWRLNRGLQTEMFLR